MEIESNIPLPSTSRKPSGYKAPWERIGISEDYLTVLDLDDKLQVGESTVVMVRNRSTFSVNLSNLSKKREYRFVSKCEDKDINLFRVWKIKKEEDEEQDVISFPIPTLTELELPKNDYQRAKLIYEKFRKNEYAEFVAQNVTDFKKYLRGLTGSRYQNFFIAPVSYLESKKNAIRVCRVK